MTQGRFHGEDWVVKRPQVRLQGRDWVVKRPTIQQQRDDLVDMRPKVRLKGEDWVVKRSELTFSKASPGRRSMTKKNRFPRSTSFKSFCVYVALILE